MDANGGTHCRGFNLYGQINVPPDLFNPTQISAGTSHTCAIGDAGVVCWGRNTWGQLTVPILQNPIQVTTGAHHTCALDDNGVVCWGSNSYEERTVPSLSNPTQVTAGLNLTCALDDSGVVCWGRNDYGQANVPATLLNPTKITIGYYFTCALDDTGIVCWGRNDDGQTSVPNNALDFSIQITNLQITESILPGDFIFTVTVSGSLPAGQNVFVNFDNQQGGWLLDTDPGGHLELQYQGNNVYSTEYRLVKPGLRSFRAGIFDKDGDTDPNNDILIGNYSDNLTCTSSTCLAAVIRPNSYGDPAVLGNGSQLFKQVDVANGNYHLSMTDMVVPGKGPSLVFSRAYNSLADQPWSFGYEMKARFFDDVDIDGVTILSTDRRIVIGPREDGSLLYYFKDMDGLWYTFTSGNFDQLIENGDGSFVLYTQGNRLYRFADPDGVEAGRLNKIEDRLGNALTLNYTSNNLTSVTDANTRTHTIIRDGNNRIQRVTDFTGRYVEYTYDGNGMITGVRNMRGDTITYSYLDTIGDDRYRLATFTDPRNIIQQTLTYDAKGKVKDLTDADSQLTQFIYPRITSPASSIFLGKEMTGIKRPVVDSLNHNLAFVLDKNRTRIEERLDAINASDYNAGDYENSIRSKQRYQSIDSRSRFAEQGLLTKMVEPKNITSDKATLISYSNTAKGRPVEVSDAKGNTTTASYASLSGQNLTVLKTSQQPGVSTTTRYQDFTGTGKAKTITNPLNFISTRVFDAATDWLTQSTNARNAQTTYTYDVYGNVTDITNALSGQTNRSYDTLGRITEETSPLGLVTSYTYDEHSNVLTKTEQSTGISYLTQYSYDASDNLIFTIDPRGHQTNYVYDDLNRKIEDNYQVNSVPHSRTYTYDAMGRLSTVTNERGHTSSTHYDARSQVLSKVNPLQLTTVTYTYDDNGNVSTVTDAEQRTVTTTYDEINRKTRVEDEQGNYQTWTYNPAGQIASHRDRRGKTTYYEYDAVSNLVKLTDPQGGITESTYDGNGNLLTIKDPNLHTTSYTYDALDRRINTMLHNGQQWTYSCNASNYKRITFSNHSTVF